MDSVCSWGSRAWMGAVFAHLSFLSVAQRFEELERCLLPCYDFLLVLWWWWLSVAGFPSHWQPLWHLWHFGFLVPKSMPSLFLRFRRFSLVWVNFLWPRLNYPKYNIRGVDGDKDSEGGKSGLLSSLKIKVWSPAPHGETRELTLESCPWIYTLTPWHSWSCPHIMHTNSK